MERETILSLMENRGLSQSDIARATGYSSATISTWLAGKYRGDNTKLEEAMQSLVERECERRQSPRHVIPFVTTTVARRVFEVARLCHLDNEIGIAYGDAGLGKTRAVKEYANRNPGAILIEADMSYTARILIGDIHKRIGLTGVGTIHGMFEDIIERLRGSDRLIIVDEAEHLPYRALELLRRIHDKAGVGVLLVGMPRLIANLRGKRGEYAQLYSRVGVAARLEAIAPTDTEKIVKSILPSANGLCAVYHDEVHGNTRVLVKLLSRSLRVAEINGVQVDADIIRESKRMLIV